MTKEQFMRDLDKRLSAMPKAEREDILQDYQEHFQFGAEAGKSDAQIIAGLGYPNQIARELLADFRIEQAVKSSSGTNLLRAIFAVGGLGFLNLVFVLGPAMGIFGVLVGLWGTVLAFVVSPVLLLVFAGIGLQNFYWHDFFMSLSLAGLGILIGLVSWYVTVFFKRITLKYLKWNLKIIKGE